ncbi:hypothetical protein D3C75_502450 [compost metagenome]
MNVRLVDGKCVPGAGKRIASYHFQGVNIAQHKDGQQNRQNNRQLHRKIEYDTVCPNHTTTSSSPEFSKPLSRFQLDRKPRGVQVFGFQLFIRLLNSSAVFRCPLQRSFNVLIPVVPGMVSRIFNI